MKLSFIGCDVSDYDNSGFMVQVLNMCDCTFMLINIFLYTCIYLLFHADVGFEIPNVWITGFGGFVSRYLHDLKTLASVFQCSVVFLAVLVTE